MGVPVFPSVTGIFITRTLKTGQDTCMWLRTLGEHSCLHVRRGLGRWELLAGFGHVMKKGFVGLLSTESKSFYLLIQIAVK